MASCVKNADCEHHRLFDEIMAMGVINVKTHFYKFASVLMDIYMKDDNNLTCFIYMTKTNRIQHLNSVAGKYIFLRRREGQRNTVWTILLTFTLIPETRAFFYVGTDLFAVCLYHLIIHRESIDSELGLQYYINMPYHLRITAELFFFVS